jgi:predicted alpha/beta-fold hydrolase
MPFDFPTFRPHPLFRGGHLQTIAGAYWPGKYGLVAGKQHHVALPDGDSIVLHDDGPAEAKTIALLVHGLGGCGQSGYVLRTSAKLRARGVRVFRMDLRGWGAGMKVARQPLHAGRSEDAGAALAFLTRHFPDLPIHLVGFSMGANIVLKLAGELAGSAPPSLASVLAVSPPIDLVACSQAIGRSLGGAYDRRFLRSLLRHVSARSLAAPDAWTRALVPPPRTLLEFDGRFTAPLSGFADVNDYYTRASSGPLLARIAVPTLIIAAASDPIVPLAPFERASYSAMTQLAVTPCGGHLGFVAARGTDPDRRWLDWRVVEWVCQSVVRRRDESQAAQAAGRQPRLPRVATAST